LRCVAKVMDKLEIVEAIPPRVMESNFLLHLSTYIPVIITITQHWNPNSASTVCHFNIK
jgi:hypothetical protein